MNEAVPLLSASSSSSMRKCDDVNVLYGKQRVGASDEGDGIILGIAFCLSVGVFTLVEVFTFQSVSAFAEFYSTDESDMRKTMYLWFSTGALFVSFAYPLLYKFISAKYLLILSFAFILGISLALYTEPTKYIFYSLLTAIGGIVGFGNTLCVAMTRKVHRHNAGVWISANSVAFTLFNASSALITLWSTSTTEKQLIVASLGGLAAVSTAFMPDFQEVTVSPRNEKEYYTGGTLPFGPHATHLRVEFIGAIMLFMLIGNELILGGNCSTSALLNRFVSGLCSWSAYYLLFHSDFLKKPMDRTLLMKQHWQLHISRVYSLLG